MQYIAEIVLCRADEPGRIRIKADRPAVAAIHLQFGTMINVGLAQQCSNFGIGDVRHEVHPALARGAAFASDETIERLIWSNGQDACVERMGDIHVSQRDESCSRSHLASNSSGPSVG